MNCAKYLQPETENKKYFGLTKSLKIKMIADIANIID